MKPIKKIFFFPQDASSYYRQFEIDVIDYNTSDTNIKISDCDFKSYNILLEINHNEINTLLDFKNASDYRVLFLDENYFVRGGTYAKNNFNNYIIQTQSKKLLLEFLKPLPQKQSQRHIEKGIKKIEDLNKVKLPLSQEDYETLKEKMAESQIKWTDFSPELKESYSSLRSKETDKEWLKVRESEFE